MKKLIYLILLCTMMLSLCFGASKKQKSKNIVLDAKKKFAIEGVELGSDNWQEAELTKKGEVIWNHKIDNDYQQIGWELRGTDLSKYAGLRIELSPVHDFDDFHVWLENPASFGEWGFNFSKDGVAYVFFNGQNKYWGDMKNPDTEEGFLIKFGGSITNIKKTVIKSIELIKKEDVPDVSYLDLLGIVFGSQSFETHILGNEVTWAKGASEGSAGWDFSDVDLSDYDRIRIELESNDATGFDIVIVDKNEENWHGFGPIAPNVYEADLSGENAKWQEDDAVPFDKSQGMKVLLRTWNEKPRTKEEKTVVKSVQLLKGKHKVNENLVLEGVNFGTCNWYSNVYDGGVIEWQWNGKETGPCAGWNVRGIDFSKYKKIRIELDPASDKLNYQIRMQQNDDRSIGFNYITPYVLEANLDGSDYSWISPENKHWDISKGIDEIQIRTEISKAGHKTIVKSVTLLTDEEVILQPEEIMLYNKTLGSQRENAWVDEDYVINWNKANYAQCGWSYENLEGDYLEIKVSSTDVPLRLRIRTKINENEASYIDDDGSHIFRINLKNKKQIDAKGNEKAPEWVKSTKAFNYQGGGEILLEPASGVYKDGKKTVVEYIKVE